MMCAVGSIPINSVVGRIFSGNLNQRLQIKNHITHIGTATRITGEVIHRQERFEYVNYYNIKILMAT